MLEIYVRRSLSCCENTHAAKERLQERAKGKGRKAALLQRSESDFGKYSHAKHSLKKEQEEEAKELGLEEAVVEESKASAPGEDPKVEPEPKRKSTKSSSPQGKAQHTWFKSFLNLLFKRSPEEQKENVGQKAKEKDLRTPYSSKTEGARRPRANTCTSPTLGKASRRRPSLKKVFSFKKNVEEERGEAGARAKRPGCLPLRHVLASSPTGESPPPTGPHLGSGSAGS